MISNLRDGLKILGDGELKRAVKVTAHRVSKRLGRRSRPPAAQSSCSTLRPSRQSGENGPPPRCRLRVRRRPRPPPGRAKKAAPRPQRSGQAQGGSQGGRTKPAKTKTAGQGAKPKAAARARRGNRHEARRLHRQHLPDSGPAQAHSVYAGAAGGLPHRRLHPDARREYGGVGADVRAGGRHGARLRQSVLRRPAGAPDDLRPGHHALHHGVDHSAVVDRGHTDPRKAAEGRRARPPQDHPVDPLSDGSLRSIVQSIGTPSRCSVAGQRLGLQPRASASSR